MFHTRRESQTNGTRRCKSLVILGPISSLVLARLGHIDRGVEAVSPKGGRGSGRAANTHTPEKMRTDGPQSDLSQSSSQRDGSWSLNANWRLGRSLALPNRNTLLGSLSCTASATKLPYVSNRGREALMID